MKQPRLGNLNQLALAIGSSVQRCQECGTNDTPLWRHGPSGPKSMCNACGIRWKRNSNNPKKKKQQKTPKSKSFATFPMEEDDQLKTPPASPEVERRNSFSMDSPMRGAEGSSPLQRAYSEEVETTTTTSQLIVTEIDYSALQSSDSSEILNSSEPSSDGESVVEEDEEDDLDEPDYVEHQPRKKSSHVNMKKRRSDSKGTASKRTTTAATQNSNLVTPKLDRIDALAMVATSDFKILEFQAAYNYLLNKEAKQQILIQELMEKLEEKEDRIRHLESLLCSAPSASSRSNQISVQNLMN